MSSATCAHLLGFPRFTAADPRERVLEQRCRRLVLSSADAKPEHPDHPPSTNRAGMSGASAPCGNSSQDRMSCWSRAPISCSRWLKARMPATVDSCVRKLKGPGALCANATRVRSTGCRPVCRVRFGHRVGDLRAQTLQVSVRHQEALLLTSDMLVGGRARYPRAGRNVPDLRANVAITRYDVDHGPEDPRTLIEPGACPRSGRTRLRAGLTTPARAGTFALVNHDL
jgi:hypothetical protein